MLIKKNLKIIKQMEKNKILEKFNFSTLYLSNQKFFYVCLSLTIGVLPQMFFP